MSGTLTLASAIAALDREALARLVRARKPQGAGGIADPIGLATELLRSDSIDRALAPLDREALRVLAAHDWLFSARITAQLASLGLVGADTSRTNVVDEGCWGSGSSVVALTEVDEIVRGSLTKAGVDWQTKTAPHSPATDLMDSAAASAVAPSEPSTAAGTWFTPALTTVAEAAECLRSLSRDPLRLNRSGSVGVAAARDLAERTATTSESVSHVLRRLADAKLTASVGQQLVVTERAKAWLSAPHAERWLELADAFLAAIPSTLRDSLIDAAPTSAVFDPQLGQASSNLHLKFPLLLPSDLARAREFVADAELLGCTAQGALTPFALRLLAGENLSLHELEAVLPPAATGVYLQPDLTLLAPGPLSPDAETALAELTLPEQIGPASMRRVTEASLAAAFERGLTPEFARETFARLSLTGMPQPLEYLLTSVAEHLGRIVVHGHHGNHGDEGRSRIHVAQPALAQTVLVDRQLQHLQLTLSPSERQNDVTVLFSRLRPDHVVSAFNEARYHASLAGAAHAFKEPDPTVSIQKLDTDSLDPDQTADPIEEMIDRVFDAARTEPEAAEFTRMLELAIRDKAAVRVTAEARGQQHTFTLTPVALTDGRLRATDIAAGVERTLPVSMIVAVDTA